MHWSVACPSPRHWWGRSRRCRGTAPHVIQGLTLIELVIVVAIIATLAAIAVPAYSAYVDKARVIQAIAAIRQISTDIAVYRVDAGALPASLDDVGYGTLLDPWGNPYQYMNIETAKGNGGLRKDKSLVPLNSDYDLYSIGKDGESKQPLAPKVSHDDIIRANDGGYIGLASMY